LNHFKKEQSGQSALRIQKHKILALDFCPRGNNRLNAYLATLELHNVRFFGHTDTGLKGEQRNNEDRGRNHFGDYPQSELDQVAIRLHQRPGKTLIFETSASNFKPVLHRPIEAAPSLRKFQLERFGSSFPAILEFVLTFRCARQLPKHLINKRQLSAAGTRNAG
jgi:hypothetical protein